MTARAPYGRESKYAPVPVGGVEPVTYYDQPQLKPSLYGWRVALYIFIAGLSGGSQLLATMADLAGGEGGRGAVRRGRGLALLVVAAGPALLIADLHIPRRFYNMLRIFRPTSPMSIGTYLLSGFSLFSIVTAGAGCLGRSGGAWRTVARISQVPAALAGAGISTYTAALLAATSSPYWAAAPRSLGVQFAGSAVASGAAALALGERASGDPEMARRLEAVAVLATGTELAATVRAARRRKAKGLGGDDGREPGPASTDDALGIASGNLAVAAAAVPIGLYAVGVLRPVRRPALAVAASLALLAGGLLLRRSVLRAGNESARRPQESLRFAQLPARGAR